ncbi:MAG: acyltransferase, partial [Arcobacter sp.]
FTSIVILLALMIIFSLKKFDNKFLAIYGIYSFEVYLIHWPLIGRYDVFFDFLPSWAAVIVWMISFIILSILLQKIVKPISAWVDKIAK